MMLEEIRLETIFIISLLPAMAFINNIVPLLLAIKNFDWRIVQGNSSRMRKTFKK